MSTKLGSPTYSFQYTNYYPVQGQPDFSASRTIANLNMNTEANDDGITPTDWFTFINNVLTGLGVSYIDPNKGVLPKLVETRYWEIV